MTSDALIEEINVAYRRLSAAVEDLARADGEIAEHVRKVRLDNAETILEAKNERTANLYLDGLLDTEDHRRLETDRARAELDLQRARHEVERLHLVVRLLGTQASEGTQWSSTLALHTPPTAWEEAGTRSGERVARGFGRWHHARRRETLTRSSRSGRQRGGAKRWHVLPPRTIGSDSTTGERSDTLPGAIPKGRLFSTPMACRDRD